MITITYDTYVSYTRLGLGSKVGVPNAGTYLSRFVIYDDRDEFYMPLTCLSIISQGHVECLIRAGLADKSKSDPQLHVANVLAELVAIVRLAGPALAGDEINRRVREAAISFLRQNLKA